MCQRLFSLFALLNAGLLLAQTTDPTVEWRLDRVECHEVGAMLSFVGDVSHRSGQGTLVLDGLPSDVDVSNATIELPDGVRLVAVDLVHRASDVQREVRDVEAQLAGERLALALEEALLEALDQERAFLQANRAIGGESEVLLVDDVEEMRHYVAQRHRELALERVDLVTNIQALARSVEDLERALATLVARGRDTHPALSLVVQGSGSGTVKVRVATALAGWVSSYDVSWQESDRALKVDRYARVVQSTGWPWENVEIVFRTGQPLSELAAPTGQAQEVQLRDEPAFKSAYCASYEWVNSGLTNIQAREDVLRGQASFASTWSMGGSTRVTLDGEGRPSRVFLDSHEFEATPNWSLDAQVADAASRSTHFDGWMDAQLLSGEGRIFQGNAMVGVVPFNVPAWGDSLEIHLGRDSDVHITRSMLQDRSGTKKLSGKREIQQVRSLQVHNDKPEPVTVDVVEWVPKSARVEVEVVVQHGGVWDPEMGSIRWQGVTVPAGQTWVTELALTVRVPRGVVVTNL